MIKNSQRNSTRRFPVHWGGDCESTWEAMAETLRGALSLTVSGFAYASHDIGGFEACEDYFSSTSKIKPRV